MNHSRSTRTSGASHRVSLRPDLLRFGLSILLCLVLGAPAYAYEEAGRITGVVKDPTGGVVQGGTVEVRNLDTGATKRTITNQEGRYAFRALPIGTYRISVSSRGFETALKDEVRLEAGGEAVVDLSLAIARQASVVVVTAPVMNRPMVVETDPRAPRQPIPAHDGGDYLKSIPGFSIIRKGGTDGDPVFRGMAGSRLNILMDGQQVLGGCGGRMDPPTAYIFPAAYERISVLKGPQTVLYGPNASAGTVLFERDRRRTEHGGAAVLSSLTAGSFGRHDEMFDARASISNGYVQGIATRSHAGDYRDGNGAWVHSSYTRWSTFAALGWTPRDNAFLELSVAKSDGRAAYADRMMDGTVFARDNVGIKFDWRNISNRLQRVETQVYYNYIDHVMDNYSLRKPGTSFSTNNPDRQTAGARAAATLAFGYRTSVVAGFDMQRNIHRFRGATAASAALATNAYLAAPRVADMRFNQWGAFAEATRLLTGRSRLVGGFRWDRHRALDSRQTSATFGATDRDSLKSGFGRYEVDVRGGDTTLYAGIGHVERFPDYWERLRVDSSTLKSVFLNLRPEKTTQLDTGVLWKSDRVSGSLSAFYGKVNDYILIRWSPAPVLTRNIDAVTTGGEAEIAYSFRRNLRADAVVAYVRGRNDTDRLPLAQQPPMEGRLGVYYDGQVYSVGLLARLVGRQDRVHIGSGNIVSNGMDFAPTAGFSVFSLNGGYRLKQAVLITGGIDNILDKAYAEHLSRSGAMVPGFVPLTRISEMGRTFWLKAAFDISGAWRR